MKGVGRAARMRTMGGGSRARFRPRRSVRVRILLWVLLMATLGLGVTGGERCSPSRLPASTPPRAPRWNARTGTRPGWPSPEWTPKRAPGSGTPGQRFGGDPDIVLTPGQTSSPMTAPAPTGARGTQSTSVGSEPTMSRTLPGNTQGQSHTGRPQTAQPRTHSRQVSATAVYPRPHTSSPRRTGIPRGPGPVEGTGTGRRR